MIREARLAVWLSGTALAGMLLLAVLVWRGPAALRPCNGCEIKREAAALQQRIAAVERGDLCPQCVTQLEEWGNP